MNINDFLEGMVVAVVRNDSDGLNLMGFVGKVIGFEEDRKRVCVRFEDVPAEYRDDLHTCKGRCEYGHGWTFEPDAIVPVMETDADFEPADPGDKCDFTGEQADYKAGKLRFSKMYAALVAKCSQCGEYFYTKDLHRDKDGNYYCDSCVAANSWEVCSDCGEILHSANEYVYVNENLTDEKIVCKDCINSGSYFKCSDCGGYFTSSHLTLNGYGVSICPNCASGWTTCHECDMPIRIQDDNFYCGSYFCARHNPERIAIHNYSFKPNPIFYGDGDLYMGVELEIDRGEGSVTTASEIKTKQIYCKHDGSLGGEGIEIVTHPCTLGYHINELGWDRVIETALRNDYESHNAGTCGLHVHVNRTFFGDDPESQEINISKVVILVQRFWEQIVVFSRRRRSDLDRWAKKPCADFKKEDTDSETRRKIRDERYDGDRYRAINLQNNNTIEFRMYRGTLKLETLLATLQFTDGLCRYAKEHSVEEIYDVSWDEFILDPHFVYSELLNYVRAKGLAL